MYTSIGCKGNAYVECPAPMGAVDGACSPHGESPLDAQLPGATARLAATCMMLSGPPPQHTHTHTTTHMFKRLPQE